MRARPRLVALTDWLRARDPARVDWLAASMLLAALELKLWTVAPHHDRAVAAVLVAVPCAAVAVRRRWLVPALVAVTVMALIKLVDWGGPRAAGGGVGLICLMLLFYAAGAYYSGRRSWLALALGAAACAIGTVNGGGSLAENVSLAAGIAAAPFLAGRIVRDHTARERASRQWAERLDGEREHGVRAAELAERTRLAREVHDVIAHSVSVMVIQAGGARSVMSGDRERAEEALETVERAGREALAELRRLLGVVGDGARLRDLAPQPGLDDLEALVARSNASGVTARLRVEGLPPTVSPGLGLCAYRVVQEALTNTIKHAGPTHAQVMLRWRADALDLEVVDRGAAGPPAPPPAERGHGLAGMRERVALHGGRVVAGPVPGGGFAVRASIPLTAEDAS